MAHGDAKRKDATTQCAEVFVPTIQTFSDKIDAGKWLKPSAWGCKTKGHNYPMRRGHLRKLRRALVFALPLQVSRAPFDSPMPYPNGLSVFAGPLPKT